MPRFEKWLNEVAASAPVDHVARRALTVRLKAVRHYLQAALGGPDEAEAVHQLRVWTRRAAAALKLFRPAILESDQRDMRKLLRKLRRKAGAIRDCDVHCERLNSQPDSPPKRVLKALQEQRRKARRKLQRLRRRLTKDERFQDQADELLAGIAWPKRHSSREAPPFASWCRRELTPLAERFFELAENNLDDDQALHAVRIAGKRLRYALELSIAALRAQPCQRLYEELSDVQDRFGEVCDQMAAVAHAREWLLEARKSSRCVRKLRTLLASEEQRLTLARRKLLRWWTPQRRARLKRHWNAAQ